MFNQMLVIWYWHFKFC